jgi:multidrug efflux pump subunit AcrB
MTFIAILTLGVVASLWLPVSLMPDVDIPRITVHINAPNTPARELENGTVKSFRRQLMQVQHLEEITSESRDGSAIINMEFDYGSDIDFAFIEVNEKIDRAMSGMPNELERPRVIKASATDIPVFYLILTLSPQKPSEPGRLLPTSSAKLNPLKQPETTLKQPETTLKQPETTLLFPVSTQFTQLSSFAGQVIRKRIEQLPEVAIADISGQVFPELLIIPDLPKLQSLGLTTLDIETAIRTNNVSLGNLVIRDGQYQYNVRFNNSLLNASEIGNIYIKSIDRLLQLKDLARIIEHPGKITGKVTSNGKDAITMAIIKQSDARMADLRDNLHLLVNNFRIDYPDVEFTITRDQTSLLDYSLSNLKQSLIIGGLLAFFVMFLFLKDVRSPWLIGLAIPASLVISLLLFYITDLSLNIISLSGLILGIGMMIDNSIIVIDNITQFRERGHPLDEACILGTNEVFRPMLSSVLTTCAVFIPLIFIGGISGALFYDQAIAITIGLFVSLGVAVTLLPVYYRLVYMRGKADREVRWLRKINRLDYEKIYEKGFRFTMKNQPWIWTAVILMMIFAFWLYKDLKKEKMPPLTKSEILLHVDWNEKINIDENNRRTELTLQSIDSVREHYTCLIGGQQFLMDQGTAKGSSQSDIYFRVKEPGDLTLAMERISDFLKEAFPTAIHSFEDAGNIFALLFAEKQAPLTARLRATGDYGPYYKTHLQEAVNNLELLFPGKVPPVAWQDQIVMVAKTDLLMLYGVSQSSVLQALRNAFSENQIMLITGSETLTPVIIGESPKTLEEVIKTTTIRSSNGIPMPLSSFVSLQKDYDLKTIVAGQEGEYFPIPLLLEAKEIPPSTVKITQQLKEKGLFEASFSGSWFSNREMVRDLAFILVISLFLLYFILASQFESLKLPIIVLLEVPIDIFGALLFLKVFGSSINLMSLIGMVVMSGIIINDSILKVDTINQLQKSGMPIMKALIVGGQRRLKPILMTSLTTILALLPFMFIEGMGSDMQKPLALAVMGGMIVGTAVSLFFVPMCYYYLMRK